MTYYWPIESAEGPIDLIPIVLKVYCKQTCEHFVPILWFPSPKLFSCRHCIIVLYCDSILFFFFKASLLKLPFV